MIVEYIRYQIPENLSTEFEMAYEEAKEKLLRSEFCHHYEISRCVEKPESYIIRIEWNSIDDHMQGFRNSQEFKEFFVHVRPFFEQIEEMHHYEVLSVSK